MPVSALQWAADSGSLWVIGIDGAGEPVGRLQLDGRFEVVSKGPALRWQGGLAAARDMLADLLPVEEQVLGSEHPRTRATRQDLADWTRRADG